MSRTNFIASITAIGTENAARHDCIAEDQKNNKGLRYHKLVQMFAPAATTKAIVAQRKLLIFFRVIVVRPITDPKNNIANKV